MVSDESSMKLDKTEKQTQNNLSEIEFVNACDLFVHVMRRITLKQ